MPSMRAMVLREPAPMSQQAAPLALLDVAEPGCGPNDLLVRVSVCGVCRTDLDLVEGRLAPPHLPVIPGHQTVGVVERAGAEVTSFRPGDRVGIAWINAACGACRWCTSRRENLCPEFRSSGCDVDGGYAELARVPAAFAHRIPDALPDESAAPLLCAGAIGWRALAATGLADGEPLGLTGFGASAHLVLQFARHRFPSSPVSVFARNPEERRFARELGAAWTGDTTDAPPEALAAIIDTTPVWTPVVEALARLAPGGRLVINAIRKHRSDQTALLGLDYAAHLWMEREVRSVANVTRSDVREALDAAVAMALRPTVEARPLSEANDALAALAHGAAVRGATVLRIGPA